MHITTLNYGVIEDLHTVVKDLTGLTVQIKLERPADEQHGDLSTNVALSTFSQLTAEQKKEFHTPRQLADQITQAIQQRHLKKLYVTSVAGPGFINFSFTDTVFFEYLNKVVHHQWSEILELDRKEQKAIVEFSSPNIAKPFTIGHLRSTIIGQAVANLLEATGVTVFRDNHLGDWGTQFGKQIYAYLNIALDHSGQKTNEEILNTSAEPVKDLVRLYVEFHTLAEKQPEIDEKARAWFKKLEEGDSEARRIWQKCVDWSLKEFTRIYQRLHVSFTENEGKGYGESFFENKMGPVLQELEEKKLLIESEGAQLVFLEEEKLPPLMIMKKDGATLYATRDLATDKFRKDNVERYGDHPLIINEVGAEQAEYFRQLYAVEAKLGWYQPGQRVHVKHGLYRFQDKKMSTRKGNVIWLADVLDEAVKRAAGNEKIGLGALKWNDLKRSAHLDVAFEWDEILSMDGNSGPYMQYAYARCASILRKVDPEGVQLDEELVIDPQSPEKALLRKLFEYSEALNRAASEFAPHHVCTYLFELAQEFNHFYHQVSILKAEKSEQKYCRVKLTRAVSFTIAHGLKILGIEVVEKM